MIQRFVCILLSLLVHRSPNRLEYLDRAFSGEEVEISKEPVPIAHQDVLDKMVDERKGPPSKKAPRGTTTVTRKVSTEGIYYHREKY